MCSRHAEAGAGYGYAGLAYMPESVVIGRVEPNGEEVLGLLVWEAPLVRVITDMTWAEISSRALEMCRWNLRIAKGDARGQTYGYENARRWLRISDYALSRLMRRVEA